MLKLLFKHYHYSPKFQKGYKQEDQLQHSVDFISGMTDRYAISKFEQLFIPDEWHASEEK